MAAYTVGRHFVESMRISMQHSSAVLLRCTPFSPDMHRNYLGYLHACVRVVNNAWTDDAGDEAMQLLQDPKAEAGVPPPPKKNTRLLTMIPPRADSSQSDGCARALRLGPQGTSVGVPGDIGAPSDTSRVHGDD